MRSSVSDSVRLTRSPLDVSQDEVPVVGYRSNINEISSRIFWNSRIIDEEFSDVVSCFMGDGVA